MVHLLADPCNLLTTHDGFAGLQHGVILAAEPHALPLKFRLLPEYLNSGFNFSSHIVGKWHLGGDSIDKILFEFRLQKWLEIQRHV